MSPPTDHPQNDEDGPAARAIADALSQSTAEPSADHDARILAAAKATTDKPRGPAALGVEPLASEVQSGARAPSRRAVRRWPLTLAAGVVATIAAVLMVQAPEPIDDRVRSTVAVTPANDTVLDRWPERLSWPAGMPGARYRLMILDRAGTTLWVSEPLAVPYWQSTTAPIPGLEGQTVLWAVRIEGPQQQELGPFRFSLEG